MKKVLALLLCLLLLFPTALAAGEYAAARDLWEYWSSCSTKEPNFPDYVCGIWSTDGTERNLTIGVTDEAGKQAVLDAIADDSTVTVVFQTYPRNYLLQVQEELRPLFTQEIGVVSTSLDDRNNRIEIALHMDYRDNEATKKAFEAVYSAYGDAVAVTFADGWCEAPVGRDVVGRDSVLTAGPIAAPLTGGGTGSPLSLPLLLTAAAAAAALLLLWQRQRRKARQTADGPVVTDAPLTLRETARQVKDSEAAPSPALDEVIRRAAEEKK